MDRTGYGLQCAATALFLVAAERVPHGLFVLPGLPQSDPDSLEAGGRFALFVLALAIVAAAALVLSLAWWPGVGAIVVATAAALGAALGIAVLLTDVAALDAMPGLDGYVAQASLAAAGAGALATASSARWLRRRRRSVPPRPLGSGGTGAASGVPTGHSPAG